MRTLLILLFMTIGLSSFCQYPMTDNFTAIGGVGQWSKDVTYSTPVTMGVESGVRLCYNIGTSYTSGSNYSFISPDYTSTFVDCGTNILISFNITVDIRNDDGFYFFYQNSDNSWSTSIKYTTGTWSNISVPKTTKRFSFDLYATGTGTTNTKYVHIEWFRIDCTWLLPIELISFTGEPQDRCNEIKWTTASEVNNDFFTLEKTLDGENYEILTTMNGAGNSVNNKNYQYDEYLPDTLTYYRLKQTDYDGKYVYSDLISVYRKEDKKQLLRIKNILGQEVDDNYVGIKIYYYSDGTFIRKM